MEATIQDEDSYHEEYPDPTYETEQQQGVEHDHHQDLIDFYNYQPDLNSNKYYENYSNDHINVRQIISSTHRGPISIPRINVYESPILTTTSSSGIITYIVLDTGATASLISKQMADKLKLQIIPTVHRTVQVDGESGLKVLGETHTDFFLKNKILTFSALVINKMGTPILGGHKLSKGK